LRAGAGHLPDDELMEFLFLRHAESEGNVRGIMQGRRDYALSDSGNRQVALLTRHLVSCQFVSRQPDQIYCSPLERTRMTIAPFCEQAPELAYVTHEDLVEVDSGILSGLTWEEARIQHPEVCLAFKAARDWGAVPDGESKQMLWQRAESFIAYLGAQHPDDSLILIVTHGGFIRACLSVLAGIAPDEKVFLCIDNTSLSLAGIQGERRYLRYINDTRHLEACDYKPESAPH
jgi:broad specificity phosphatase PhoE